MKNKLNIFKAVAYHLSFTKAAQQLYISQPAISKAIRNLEEEFKTTFFNRKRNAIELTEEGKSFLIYANRILDIYAEMENQFLNQNENFPTIISFGVSTTISDYIIPKVIAKFRMQFPKVKFKIKSENSDTIQNLILTQQLDFGITEGKNTNRKLHFKELMKDQIVLVTNANNAAFKNGITDLETLSTLPIIEREQGSGTREIIYTYLKQHGLQDMNVVVRLNSTEAIKNYLYYCDSYAFISVNAIKDDLKTNKLKVVEVKNFIIERWFYFVSRTGYQSALMDFFEKFTRNNYN